MWVTLGPPEGHSEDLLELLGACHARIRRFSRLAFELGDRLELKPPEVLEAAARCERYFVEALPLHVRDEEDGVLPRLLGREPALDAALRAMETQHRDHEPVLEELVEALRAVRDAPEGALPRTNLARVAGVLASALEAHLAHEEALVFPAIERLLGPEERVEMVAELRARRRGHR